MRTERPTRFPPVAGTLALVVCLAAGLLLGARPAGEAPSEVLVKRAHYVMGTIFEIAAYGENRQETAQAIEEAFAAIRQADQVMSHYREQSDLSRLNRRGAQEKVTVPRELYDVLQESLRYAELTGGAFEITVGPLVRLWETAAEENRLPSAKELKAAKSRVGFRNIRLLPGSRVRLARPGVELDLGGIGKGWAVDRAVEVLRARGIRRAFLSAGTSTVYGLGSPDNESGWLVEVRSPCNPEASLRTFRLRNASLSTSAAYERYWEVAGRRYGHIVDPRTGWPAEPLAGATVVAPTATESDALSTAVFVMGQEEGSRLLRRLHRDGLLVSRSADGCVVQKERNPNVDSIRNSEKGMSDDMH